MVEPNTHLVITGDFRVRPIEYNLMAIQVQIISRTLIQWNGSCFNQIKDAPQSIHLRNTVVFGCCISPQSEKKLGEKLRQGI